MRLTFERRLTRPSGLAGLALVVSVAAALLIGAVLLLLVGANPLAAYGDMLRGAFGDNFALTQTLVKATPLLLTGLAVTFALKAGLWNIGAEGQFVIGACCAAGVALFGVNVIPAPLLIPAVIAAGFVGGAVWGLVAGLFKVIFNVNEIVTTLMLNYIALEWMEYLYFDAWRNPRGFGFPGTAEFARETWLPRLTGTLHIGFIIALAACVVIWFIVRRTTWGYELRVIGASLPAARYSGIHLARNLLLVMVISGGIAGLAGMGEVAGISHRLQNGIAVGYGYTGLIVAFLARTSPLGVIPTAVFIAGLTVGSEQLQLTMNLPSAFAQILQGAILLCVIAGDVLLRYQVRVVWRRSARERTA